MPTEPHNPPGNTLPDDAPPFRYGAALANEIEARWQDRWESERAYDAPNPGESGFDAARPKKFILDMFPYPSGAGLHVGHPLGYIATDIYARYLRMTGHRVLHAMGFDAFGLPAEQYAVQTGTHPRVTTERNIATMRAQLRRLGLGHEARRSVATTDEGFYRWTQWIFLRIYHAWYDAGAEGRGGGRGRARPIAELVAQFEAGERATSSGRPWAKLNEDQRRAEVDGHRLAFLAEAPVNWCPKLGTVLANEEVTADGRSERGNYPVFKRPMKQWMMRITAYAERLAADLDRVDWPEPIRQMQRNWIGRSAGAFVDFDCSTRRIRVFTTRPDTLSGATYLVLSPEHEMVDQLMPERYGAAGFARAIFPGAEGLVARNAPPRDMVGAYRAHAKSRSDEARREGDEKTGAFTGAYAINPMNGARIPVFVADYVLSGYGTGAIMAVPGQDQRDWDFAKAFGLPIVRTVQPPADFNGEAYVGEGPAINSGILDGLPVEEAKQRIGAHLRAIGRGEPTVTYKLRDWLFSRQRYWGEPFPVVYDESGRAHPIPEGMLPVRLPELDNFQPESSDDPDAPPRPPLARASDWARVELDLGEGTKRYTRETNTMPNWAGSCWYYLRYADPWNERAFVGREAERYWMGGNGVDLYVGGVEHAVLHLLYARFWHKVLYDLEEVSTPEPFGRLFNQGYIQAAAYTDERGVYVEAAGVEERGGSFWFGGGPVRREFGKMGKSLKNAVAPDEVCASYGCDTLRVYEMSMGPLEASKPWNTRDIAGAHRFLQRVWRNLIDERTGATRVADGPGEPDLRRALHKTIAAVRRDMETLGFNTAVAKLIEFNNELTKRCGPDSGAPVPREAAEALVLMIAPLAPHLAEELWSRVAGASRGSVVRAPYPVCDESLARETSVEVPVQILGRLRGKVSVPADADARALEAAALADEKIAALIAGKPVKKVIVVPGKMVNIVTG
ncbi:MAG: leucine--tRNA ligase [Phycisphaerae bacterium]|nr:leucine--tRNA ligase [Phycisphaerae bacterium]